MKAGTHQHRKGQGTLEYLLILAVVILAVVAATVVLRPSFDKQMAASEKTIKAAGTKLQEKLQ